MVLAFMNRLSAGQLHRPQVDVHAVEVVLQDGGGDSLVRSILDHVTQPWSRASRYMASNTSQA